MIVVFTDLDGTLLDKESYAHEPAEEALTQLRMRSVPVIFCTSKTRAETEVWRSRLGNRDPFVVENGGAVFIPDGYFGERSANLRNGYEVLELGQPYATLVRVLRESSNETGVAVTGFHEMTAAEVAADSGLSPDEAKLARQREYDEPFTVRAGEDPEPLLRAITARGCRWTRGGRYFHITGGNDKAMAVAKLVDRFRRHNETVLSVGLGDGLNDAEFLNAVEVQVLIPSVQIEALRKAVPRGTVAGARGPAGWNSAVLEILSKVLPG